MCGIRCFIKQEFKKIPKTMFFERETTFLFHFESHRVLFHFEEMDSSVGSMKKN
jgi:hypothetical protein